jgi:hypothetical protein
MEEPGEQCAVVFAYIVTLTSRIHLMQRRQCIVLQVSYGHCPLPRLENKTFLWEVVNVFVKRSEICFICL